MSDAEPSAPAVSGGASWPRPKVKIGSGGGGGILECTPKVRHGTKGPATLNRGELCWCPDNSILVN